MSSLRNIVAVDASVVECTLVIVFVSHEVHHPQCRVDNTNISKVVNVIYCLTMSSMDGSL